MALLTTIYSLNTKATKKRVVTKKKIPTVVPFINSREMQSAEYGIAASLAIHSYDKRVPMVMMTYLL